MTDENENIVPSRVPYQEQSTDEIPSRNPRSKSVPWNREYNKERVNKYFVKKMPDGKVYAIMSNEEMIKPIKVLVEQPQDPKEWRQKIKEAFQKCDSIWEDFMRGRSMVDYKTEKLLKSKPFWNIFSKPLKSFWNLLRRQ